MTEIHSDVRRMQFMLRDLITVMHSEISKRATDSPTVLNLVDQVKAAEARADDLARRLAEAESRNSALEHKLNAAEERLSQVEENLNSTTNETGETLKSQGEQIRVLQKQMRASLDCHLRGREALNSLSAATKRLVMLRGDSEASIGL